MQRESRETQRARQEAIAKYEQALQIDPNNASFHALLADQYRAEGRHDEAIHQYRTAVSLLPHGPQTARWKTNLRQTMEEQAGHNKHNFTVCHHCQADMPTNAKVCTRCGTTLQMSFGEWLSKPENHRPIVRQTAIATMLAIIILTIFSSLPLEWKASVLCGTVIVAAYYILRVDSGK